VDAKLYGAQTCAQEAEKGAEFPGDTLPRSLGVEEPEVIAPQSAGSTGGPVAKLRR